MINLNNIDIQKLCIILVGNIRKQNKNIETIYGVPRGGIPVAYLLSGHLNAIVVDAPEEADIIVDDLVDSGKTKERYSKYNKPFYALIDKRVDEKYQDWITFTWENVDKDTPIEDNLERVYQYLQGDIKVENRQDIAHKLQDIMEKLLEAKE